MKQENKLAQKIRNKEFIFTAEYLPSLSVNRADIESRAKYFNNSITAVNVADNHYGIAISSLAASVILNQSGIEPIYQIVTRDRNRIALQSDLLGASLLGLNNVLCLSGYHQTLIGHPESANVFDIDSVQLIAMLKKMNQGQLLDGKKISNGFSMLVGAAANPYLKPLEMNMLRLKKKIAAGTEFIQTQAVFDVAMFQQWLATMKQNGFTEKVALLAGILPLQSAAQAEELSERHTDIIIPSAMIERIKAAGDETAQQKEGLKIAAEIIKQLKDMPGLRGIHIFSGGQEEIIPDLLAAI
jgi:methylenetetrahydrofolate reductase (NADPH)